MSPSGLPSRRSEECPRTPNRSPQPVQLRLILAPAFYSRFSRSFSSAATKTGMEVTEGRKENPPKERTQHARAAHNPRIMIIQRNNGLFIGEKSARLDSARASFLAARPSLCRARIHRSARESVRPRRRQPMPILFFLRKPRFAGSERENGDIILLALPP